MTKPFHFASVVAAFAVAGASPALAECALTLSSGSTAAIANYDALAGGTFVAPIAIRATNSGTSACTGTIGFDARRNNDRLRGPQNETMAFQIAAEDSVSRTIFDPLTPQNAGLRVMVAAGGAIELRPQLVVEGAQRGVSGRYDAQIDVLYRDDRAPQRAVTSALTVAANVVPSVQANFVGLDGGADSSATLALGELSTGLKRSIGLQLRANADVDVTVTSQNRGRLVRDGGGGDIRYDLAIGGGQVNLQQIDQVKLRLADSVRGNTQQMQIEVGNIDRAVAGTYRDTVTFRISAR